MQSRLIYMVAVDLYKASPRASLGTATGAK